VVRVPLHQERTIKKNKQQTPKTKPSPANTMTPDNTTPPDTNATTGPPPYWTPRRHEIKHWMQRNAPSLAELYEGAVILLDDKPLPGRVRFIAHAVREIRNRLPDTISGPTKKQRLDYTSRLDDIAKHPGVQTLITDLSDTTIPATTTITIDRTLAKKIGKLLNDHRKTRAKPLDAARRLFQGLAPENTPLRDTLTPVLQQWLTITKWFVDRAHDAGHTDNYYPEQELRHQFTILESTLNALITPFFDTLEDLDAILEQANN
jgi:hypothetical protein